MLKNKRMSIPVSREETDEIFKDDSYILQFEYNDIYTVLFSFEKNMDEEFSLSIIILNIISEIKIKKTIPGIGELDSFFDKVFMVEFPSDNINFLIKLDRDGGTVQKFTFSCNISRQIKKFGTIYLYSHISYTNFQDDIELVKLCYKYACFYSQVFGVESGDYVNNVLDEKFYNVDKHFIEKLMYNGYYSVQEIKDNILIPPEKLKTVISMTSTNREDTKNKIVLLTQCLISDASYNEISQQIIDMIDVEAENFLNLI